MTAREVISILLPSIEELNLMLTRIRQKYNLPDLTIADEETKKAVNSDPQYDWEAIRQDIEKGLVEFFEPVIKKSGMDKWLEIFTGIINNSMQIKAVLTSDMLGANEGEADKFIDALNLNAKQGLEMIHQVYVQGSKRLVEHLRTGRPVDIPAEIFNLMFTVKLLPDNEKVVIAIGLEYNDPDEMAEDFYLEMKRQFPNAPRFTEKDKETAGYLSMKNRGVELAEITRIDIERHPEAMIYSIDDLEYDAEFTNRKETLNRRMLRLQAEINKAKTEEKDTDKT
ncbi:MAG: hypothetical protein WBW94_08285 [Anaerolineales bacterium]